MYFDLVCVNCKYLANATSYNKISPISNSKYCLSNRISISIFKNGLNITLYILIIISVAFIYTDLKVAK